MLLGRLEFYSLLILLFPETWTRAFAGDGRQRAAPADPAPGA